MLVLMVFSTIQLFNIVFRGYAPFFSSNKKFMKKILEEEIEINKNYNIYELGCGFAWFLSLAEKQFKNVNYIGIEYSFLPYLLSKIRLKIIKSKIKIIKQNLFQTNLSNANLIYCYLLPNMMQKLAMKLKKECKCGTIIISYRFLMPNVDLYKKISFKKNHFYFYKL